MHPRYPDVVHKQTSCVWEVTSLLVGGTQKAVAPLLKKTEHPLRLSLSVESVVAQTSWDSAGHRYHHRHPLLSIGSPKQVGDLSPIAAGQADLLVLAPLPLCGSSPWRA